MENTSTREKNSSTEGAPPATTGPVTTSDRIPEMVIEDGARDIARAGSEMAHAVTNAGIAVAEDIERGVQTIVDASEVVASDVAAAGRRVGRDAKDSVSGPPKPLPSATEPVVAATLSQTP